MKTSKITKVLCAGMTAALMATSFTACSKTERHNDPWHGFFQRNQGVRSGCFRGASDFTYLKTKKVV